jgi:hypothetical protein
VIRYTERQWWFNIRKWRVVRGRFFAIQCCMDWWSGALWVSLGWVGFHVQYLMPDLSTDVSVSSAGLAWDATHPVREGALIFRKLRETRRYHAGSLHEVVQWKSEVR